MRAAMVLVVSAIAIPCSGGGERKTASAVELYARGDYAAVVALVGPRHHSDKAGIQERLLLARAYLHLGRAEDALAVARAVLNADAENPEANALAGLLLHRGGKHQEAVEFLLKAHRLKRDAPSALALGECYHALGQDAKARRYLAKALDSDARNPEASFLLGRLCLERGYGALAEKYLLLAREAGMKGKELHRLLGRAYLVQRKFLGPVRVVRLPGEYKPGEAAEGYVVLQPLPGRSGTYKVCSRFSALCEGLALLEAEPTDPDALEMVARGWLEAGRPGLAEAAIRRLSALEPHSARAVGLLATLFLRQKKMGELRDLAASTAARKALGARRCADLLYRAALERIAAGQRAEAAKLLAEAKALWPTSLKVLRSLADLARSAGRGSDARGYYERLAELFPDSPEADTWRNLAAALATKGGAK